MDLDTAIQKHAEWKMKFRSAMSQHESMDAATIAKDNCCELGKWLHGDGKTKFGKLSSHGGCVSSHAAFHVEAGKVAQAINAKKYTEAVAVCNDLIGNSSYAVASDYWSMFQKDVAEHSEFILRVPMDDKVDMGSGSVWVNFTLHYSQVFGNITSTWNGPCTTSTFFDTWDKVNDVRYHDDRIKAECGFNQGFLVGQQYGLDGTALTQRNGSPLIFVPELNLQSSAENAGVRVVKFAPNSATTHQFSSPNDVPIMRISDIYLIRAESKLRNGDAAGALADVNYIRAKRSAAGKTLPALTSVTLADVLKERGYELYWEGLRRQDLVRFGKFGDVWQEKPATTATKTMLYPIPTSALDVNQNLKQNPGY